MDLSGIPTPSYVVDEAKLRENLQILRDVRERAGCRILLAQKAFSMFAVYPLIAQYLDGTTASGLYEARLAHEEMRHGERKERADAGAGQGAAAGERADESADTPLENHVYAPAFRAADIEELGRICEHVTFNSFAQLSRFGERVLALHRESFPELFPAGSGRTGIGLRLNPECSTQGEHAIYDPCAPGSRLGVTEGALRQGMREHPQAFSLVDGLHVHTLCEQNADALETTLEAVEEHFGDLLRSEQIRWLNLGGGHHITREDYDRQLLISLVQRVRQRYGVEVVLEPGEAIALNAGYLVTEVMDIVDNGIKTLILDASAACHMPDVLEMPYRPPLRGGGEPGERAFTYRLSSLTCLAGDIIGDYSFDREIRIGDRLVFEDMAIYSMVKNNTFNGIPLPSIWLLREDGTCEPVRSFGYRDFKERLS